MKHKPCSWVNPFLSLQSSTGLNLNLISIMGSSKKHHQLNGRGKESDGKKWAIAGILIRGSLKSMKTKQKERESDDDDSDESTTPTAKESRIPETLPCPAAPRKH
ncbi:Cyclin-dependent protein kinase inhibitor SMR6 [Camellia lanceoleosa]|uniref:Cyclin-dependent protein kinase inhibitor SMR6 n=1 Tax=Camellia lanceoleosa TaxID=1840588 RepID=A0ACC0H1E6_9ERIC|nr:Cyclin-dependent protein kinase inhibitor SMR6 [Camellia lanceoleosa]